jgi:ubiquinol-cytochrome c reductase iron-sulfur subunit
VSDHSSHEVAHRPAAGQELADPIADPGLPEHQPRLTDVDPKAANRAERQIAGMFGVATLLVIAFVVLYLIVPRDSAFLGLGASNLALGLTLGGALTLIGAGCIQWTRKLMSDHEIVQERKSYRVTAESQADAMDTLKNAAVESALDRRKLLRRSLIGAMAALGIPVVILLGDLGPLPGNSSVSTIWRRGVRIVNDVSNKPLRPEDIKLGQLVNALPANIEDLEEGAPRNNAKAKAAVILVRMEEGEIRAMPNRRNWSVGGIMCYSKICTHVGCPTNLYERVTHHLLCPCHQSTFDLSDSGKVVFGPAARSLPQLPIMVDPDGFLVAQSDFKEPVGPSYWERGD